MSRKMKKGLIIGISMFFLLILFTIGYIYTEINGTFKNDKEIAVMINQGDTTTKIAQSLKTAGIISSESLFKTYFKMDKSGAVLKQGAFVIKGNGGYKNIVTVLSGKPNDSANNLTLTIIEGDNLLEIGEKIQKKNMGTTEEFLTSINKQYGFSFESYVSDNPLKLFRNEGFAFPDTYFLTKGMTMDALAKMILKNFDDKMKPEYYKEMELNGKTLDEIIALASVIQHEAGDKNEMKKVASVFYNRLESKDLRKLQSDVTVFYARDIVGVRSGGNKKMIDAYSTYLSEGIPVGAICNPGLEAITASLYPDKTEYLYFLTDKNKKFYYAKTFAEHEKYLAESKKVNQQP